MIQNLTSMSSREREWLARVIGQVSQQVKIPPQLPWRNKSSITNDIIMGSRYNIEG
jgi:hypothetical protein